MPNGHNGNSVKEHQSLMDFKCTVRGTAGEGTHATRLLPLSPPFPTQTRSASQEVKVTTHKGRVERLPRPSLSLFPYFRSHLISGRSDGKRRKRRNVLRHLHKARKIETASCCLKGRERSRRVSHQCKARVCQTRS